MKKIFQLLLLLCVISTANAQSFTPPAFADVDNTSAITLITCLVY